MREWFRRQGLARPRRGRVLGGVCAALGRRFDVSPWLIRLLAVVSIVAPGPQVLAYLVLWVLLPDE